ncbi:MAG: hypothetical protein ACRELB_26410 [Polyangiaceae bacterium]
MVFVALAVAGGLALAGCPGAATTTTYTPITGVVIKSSDLVVGRGCGTGPGQLYRYAAVLSYIDDGTVQNVPFTSGVFDCYADGIFSNLPADSSGSTSFSIFIAAFDQAAFPAALDCVAGTDEAGTPIPCPGDDPATVLASAGTPTWTTSCTATQQYGVPVLAACAPLEETGGDDAGATEAGAIDAGPAPGLPITVSTSGFVLPDGGTLTCDSQYTAAQATYSVSGQTGQTVLASCPSALTLSPTVAGATYALTVQLFAGASPVATVTCSAEASSTQAVLATCAPAVLGPAVPPGDP